MQGQRAEDTSSQLPCPEAVAGGCLEEEGFALPAVDGQHQARVKKPSEGGHRKAGGREPPARSLLNNLGQWSERFKPSGHFSSSSQF